MARGNILTVCSAIFISFGGFLFGYDSGIISSTIALPHFTRYFENPSDDVTGGIVSSFQGGAVLGTILSMIFSDRLGRKMIIFAGAVVSAFGSALQAGAISMGMLIAGRFIGGVAVGILTSNIPLFAAEISPPRWRGALSGLLQELLSFGFLVAQWLGYGCSFVESDFSWRFPLAFQCVPALILASGIWFLQESPRWLMEKDRHEEAKSTLYKLRNGANESSIELEFIEIRDVIAADREMISKISFTSIFTRPSWRRRLLLGAGVQAFGALSGINVINYYGPRIYSLLGIDTQTSLMIIGISGVLSVVYCTIGLLLLDKLGRVKPLIVSAVGLAASLLVNAVQAQYIDSTNFNQLRSMVAMNFVFNLAFVPVGIISWVYPAEIFPVEIRAWANSLTTFTNWIINLVFAQISPTALTNIGFAYFYVFFVFNVIAALCYWFFYPETKGRTLEQMDVLFGDQLVPHALEDPEGAAALKKDVETATHVEKS